MNQCQDCNKTFSQRNGLNRHMRQSCPQKKCSNCRKYFLTVSLLKDHQKTCIPASVPRSTCEFCLKSFVQRGDMLYHQRTTCKKIPVKPGSTSKIECSGCKRQFASTKSLYQHKKIPVLHGEKNRLFAISVSRHS
ncbi:hypothetical protein B566_EDAN005956 [Ephemera danica]|nr:hypothetical protein B566_EDAN005956 [Ephemera danica]